MSSDYSLNTFDNHLEINLLCWINSLWIHFSYFINCRNRLKAKAAAAQPEQSKASQEEAVTKDSDLSSIYGSVKEEFVRQPFKNPELAFKEAMQLIAQEDWEKKCHAMNIIRRLSLYHEDLTVNNIHTIVLALVPEVKPYYIQKCKCIV